jgi:replicative DNA helicase
MIDLPRKESREERVPPHDVAAERAVLGSVLIDSVAVAEVVGALDASDFYVGAHQVIFSAVEDLFARSIAVDVVILREELARTSMLERAGGEEGIYALSEAVPTAANAQHYARIVRDLSLRRSVIRECTRAVQAAYEGEEGGRELLDYAEGLLFALDREGGSTASTHIKDIVTPLFKEIDEGNLGRTGIPTHFYEIDDLIGGLQPANLIVVAGRPSMGKTTLALNIAEQVGIVENKPVVIFSLEMSKSQVALNMLCSNARVNAQNLRRKQIRPEEWSKLSEAAGRLSGSPIFIDDTPSLSVLALRAKVRRLRHQHGVALVIVDYMQMMEAPRAENRQQEISMISRSLKGIARELNVPVIAVSQLSRAVESREDHRPRMSDLRESGAIEQDADLIIFLYRDEYYDPREENRGRAEGIIAKQRNGPTGTVHLSFQAQFMRFENLASYQPPY